jgi:hypothetical protein
MRDALEANELSIAAPLRQIVGEGMAAGQFAEGNPSDVTSALIGAMLMQIVSRHMRAAAINADETITEIADIALRVVAGPGR